MFDNIYAIVTKVYGRLYSAEQCEWMSAHIVDEINAGRFRSAGDIKMYLWMQTTGGGVAEYTALAIRDMYPNLINESLTESRYL